MGPKQHALSPVNDHQNYNREMRMHLGHKLFFVDKLPVPITDIRLFVDFGCGDAELLRLLSKINASAMFLGIESDHNQKLAATSNFADVHLMHTLWALPLAPWAIKRTPKVLIMSSVIHEVISFAGSGFNLQAWWRNVEDLGFDYIVIRDFCLPLWCDGLPIEHDFREAISTRGSPWDRQALGDMWLRWGMTTHRDFMHYLMKRPYRDNWKRELQENYVALCDEALRAVVTLSGRYRIHHFEQTVTPAFTRGTMEAFGFDPETPTHAEVILARNNINHAGLSAQGQDLEQPGAAGPDLAA